MASILAVPGLEENTSDLFRLRLIAIAKRNTWSADALAAVMSSESARTFRSDIASGGGTWTAGSTKAFGLIQFIPPTARALGIEPAALAGLTPEDQLMWVEKYFQKFGKTLGATSRPVDYYLATFLPWSVGRSLDTALVKQGHDTLPGLKYEVAVGTMKERRDKYKAEGIVPLAYAEYYTQNRGFDPGNTGAITVRGVASVLDRVMQAARGRRIEIDVGDVGVPSDGAPTALAAMVPLSQDGGTVVLLLAAAGFAAWYWKKRKG